MLIVGIIITFIIYIYFIFFNNKILKDYFLGKKLDLYFYTKKQLFKSLVFIFLFLSYYFFYLRILNFFVKKSTTLNIFSIKEKFLEFTNSFYFPKLMLILAFFCILIFFIILYIINFYAFFFAKKNMLKIYYFFLIRFKIVIYLIIIIKKTENNFCVLFGNKYKYFLILRTYGFKLLIIIMVLKNIFLDQGNINLVLIPYYSIYYFILNIIIFIILKLKEDFDFLIVKSYYPTLNFIMDTNEESKSHYKRFLLLNECEYKFRDCIFINDITQHAPNYIFINTYKYTINSYPNDFYTKIRRIKPRLISI